MHIYSRDEIDELSKDLLPSIVLQQSNEIIILQSSLKNIEKHLNHLYKELDGKMQIPLLPSENLSVLQKMIFGRSSEKSHEVSSLFDEEQPEEDQQSQTTKPSSNKKKGSSKPKRKKSEDKVAEFVPVIEHFHYAEEQKVEELGLKIWKNQYQTSDLISIQPARIQVDRHHQQKYKFTHANTGEQSIYTAKGPLKLRDGCQYSINFTTHAAVNKYSHHLPLERQARILNTQGLEISAQSLFNQIDYAAWLLKKPVFEKFIENIHATFVNEADDTTWPNLEDLKTRKQDKFYLWAVKNQRAVCFNIFDARSQKVAKNFLGKLKGVLVTDAHSSFNILESDELILAADWCHFRRRFVWAKEYFPEESEVFLQLIGQLFKIEKQAKGQPPEKVLELRTQYSKPIAEKIRDLLDEVPTLPQSSFGRAISYGNKCWERLVVYLTNPFVPISTNDVERAIRGPAIGRKNHFGSKNLKTAKTAAIWYSIVETCKLNQIDPEIYVNYAIRAVLSKSKVLMPWEVSANDLRD
jgi:transposase